MKLRKVNDLDSIIRRINRIKEEDTRHLIIEKLDLFSEEDIRLIEDKTNLPIKDGQNIKSYFTPFVLKSLYKNLNQDLRKKEVLIFCGEKDLTEEFIFNLSQDIKFITLVGQDLEIVETIRENILQATGLSIFHSKKIDRILKNYHIIINLSNNPLIDLNKIRRESLIFDFSRNKALKDLNHKFIIEDIIFHKQNIKEDKYLKDGLPSALYESFNKKEVKDLKGLLINDKVYNYQELITNKIRQKGRF